MEKKDKCCTLEKVRIWAFTNKSQETYIRHANIRRMMQSQAAVAQGINVPCTKSVAWRRRKIYGFVSTFFYEK